MKKKQSFISNKQIAVMFTAFCFMSLGTYNSFIVNSDSFMKEEGPRFIRRLDEVYGPIKTGRKLANQGHWVKLNSNSPTGNKKIAEISYNNYQAPQVTEEQQPEIKAAISEEVNLDIAEIFNAKKYPQNLKAGEFSGSLSAHNGVLESLEVKLPNSESIQISNAEMNGNVFEYDQEGTIYSGMIYEITKGSYMVTLTNGPFEGTRMKFQAQVSNEEQFGNQEEMIPGGSEVVAEEAVPAQPEQQDFEPVVNDDGSQMEVGQFGNNENQNGDVEYVEPVQAEQINQEVPQEENYGFNFEQQNPGV